MSQAHNVYDYGSTGIPVPSTISGKNVNESYLAWKNFSPLVLSNVTPTQLPNCPCGQVKILNPLGNDVVYVGGLPGSNDNPYLIPNNPGLGRGTPIFPGNSAIFQVTNSNLLTALSTRNGDIITFQVALSMSDFHTPDSDPGPNLNTVLGLITDFVLPPNGNIDVANNVIIHVGFNFPIDPTTVTLSNISVTPGISGPGPTVYLDPTDPTIIEWNPNGANFTPGATYTVAVSANIKDTNGSNLLTPGSFSFTIYAPPPPPPPGTLSVTSVTPGDNAINVLPNTTIVVVMNHAVVPAGVTTGNVELVRVSDNVVIPSTPVLAGDNITITITPTSNLSYGTEYKVYIQNLVNTSLSIGTQSPNPWDGVVQGFAGAFTTAILPTEFSVAPANGNVNVAVTVVPIVVMNTPIIGVNTSTVQIRNHATHALIPSTPVLGMDSETITITPTSSLAYGTEFDIVVQNLQSSVPVVQSPNPETTNFTTIAPPPAPTIVSCAPVNGATGVSTTVSPIQCVMNIAVTGVNGTNVQLQNNVTHAVIPSTVSLAPDNVTINIVPSSHLDYSTTYRIFVQNLTNSIGTIESPNPEQSTFTTTAPSFTQRYNISQVTCSSNYTSSDAPGNSLGPNSGGSNNNNYSLGTVSGTLGTAFGETASVANGLTAAPITKVVIPQLGGSSDAFGNSNESGSVPTGTFGIRIVNSSGTTKYTFSSTFTASSTGNTNICQGIYGWTNITLQDVNNVYTMVVGDVILVTWSGSGNNVALVSQSNAGTYGKAAYLNGTSLTNQSGIDLAATMYSSP